MRLRTLALGTLAIAASLSLTACTGGDTSARGDASPAPGASASHSSTTGPSALPHTGPKGSAGAGKGTGEPGTDARVKDGLAPGDALTAHNFALQMDGARVEYLAEVSDPSDHEVDVVRGATRSPAVDSWIDNALTGREGRLKDVTIEQLDYQNNTVKQYRLRGAFVSKVTNPAGDSGAQALTISFFELVIA